MSYNAISDLTGSASLVDRIAACYATQPEANQDPHAWALARRWKFAAQPDWASAWQYAVDTTTSDTNPDIGAREGVISDVMILAAVQAVIAAEQPSE